MSSAAEAAAEQKRIQAEQDRREQKEISYRSKEQRQLEAKRRARLKELEELIEQAEVDIFRLENEIADPDVAANFELMTEKCNALEAKKSELDEMMDEWAGLE